MKKLLIFTCLVTVITLVACGKTTVTTTTPPVTTTVTSTPTTTTETPGPVDTIAPILTLHKTEVELAQGVEAFNARENIKMAMDDTDGNIADKVQIDMNGYEGKDSPEGEYTLVYSLTDTAGNKSTATCVLNVLKLEPSVLFNNLKIPMVYNPVINAQFSVPSGLRNWGYDLTKVTIYSKAYFEYMATNFPERIGVVWSTIMVTDADFTVTYTRHHSSFGYYALEGAVVQETSSDWCIGQAVGGNDAYCTVATGGLLANLVGRTDYAAIPDGGFVFVFTNDGPNAEGSPRWFGDQVFYNVPGKFAIGEQLTVVGNMPAMTDDNTPAYVKTNKGNKVQVTFGEQQPDLLDGITAVSKKGSNLTVTTTIYPQSADGSSFDLENPITAFDMVGGTPVDGIIPKITYAVKYEVTENGYTDHLWRTYEIVDNKSLIVATKDFMTIGDYEVPVAYNNVEALSKTETSGGFLMCSSLSSTAHLYDATTFYSTLNATKLVVDGFPEDKKNGNINYSAYFILDKNMKVVQFRFTITRDEIWTLGSDNQWTKVDGPAAATSVDDLFTTFLGDTPLLSVPRDGFILFAQNGSYNTIVRQFGINLFNSDGKFRPTEEGAQFNQQELLTNNALKMVQRGYSSIDEVISVKEYAIEQKVKFSTNDEKTYNMDFDHNWMWSGGEPNNDGNTNLRFHAEILHMITKAFSLTLDEKLVYLPNSLMIILDSNYKVVGFRLDSNLVSGATIKVRSYLSFDENGEPCDVSWDTIDGWKDVTDVSQDIHLQIPDGGYAIALQFNASFANTIIMDLVNNLTDLDLKDVSLLFVTTLKLA